jgi:hypothetical protein
MEQDRISVGAGGGREDKTRPKQICFEAMSLPWEVALQFGEMLGQLCSVEIQASWQTRNHRLYPITGME